ncbi:MAG: VWA domain-containing protein [Bdellovibrionales bacterium]
MKLFLVCLSILFFVFALARPQSGTAKAKMKSEGIEVVLLLDVSESMKAEDVKPSRLEFMKKEMIRFVEKSVGDRIGIVAFAGSAVLLTPVTQDKGALKMYIETLSTDSVSTQGTDFGKALQEAESAFKRGGLEDSEESVVTRAIIIASDGEDNEEKGLETAGENFKRWN